MFPLGFFTLPPFAAYDVNMRPEAIRKGTKANALRTAEKRIKDQISGWVAEPQSQL